MCIDLGLTSGAFHNISAKNVIISDDTANIVSIIVVHLPLVISNDYFNIFVCTVTGISDVSYFLSYSRFGKGWRV